MFRRINLGASVLGLGLIAAPATEIKGLCSPLSGAAALNLTAAAFSSPLPGTRWRIRVTVGPGGSACNITVRAKLYPTFPSPIKEVLTFPAGGGSFTTAQSYSNIVTLTSDVAPADQVKVEFEVVGVALAGNNALPIEGVCVGAEDVPQYSWAGVENSGTQLVRVDPGESLVVGKEVVAAAAGLGRMRVMGDAGSVLGRNYSASFIPKDGQTYMSVQVDPREP
jgi:hypothetical protein